MNWPADQVIKKSVADLIPYARNARTHSEAQIAQLAAAINEWGWTNPILVDESGMILAGHGRVLAAEKLKLTEVPVMVASGWTEAQKRAYVLADNKLAENAGWDSELLQIELGDLIASDFDIELAGFSLEEWNQNNEGEKDGSAADAYDEELPEETEYAITEPGDIWQLGKHRIMCGDSTNEKNVAALTNGQKALLIHADPPYGMGKESDGVQNDNLYGDELDKFQLRWWKTFRPHIVDNASVYIWGNAPDLWRLWWRADLPGTETMKFKNEIVWDKNSAIGKRSDLMLKYPTGTERCLFFVLGEQYLRNVNADRYWEGWDEIRLPLVAMAEAAQLTAKKCAEVTGVQMFSHWFTKSQWQFIAAKDYAKLQEQYPDAFTIPHAELAATHERIRGGFRKFVDGELEGKRSYFDNTHDNMCDVWQFPIVYGEERYGHATPKPVPMMERVMRSSLPEGGLCFEPFAGTGSTLIGAERAGRVCYTMELTPQYVDIVVKRWEKLTGKNAVLERTGKTFSEVANERAKADTNAA